MEKTIDEIRKVLFAPFPRPKKNSQNLLFLLLCSIACSLFILVFRPYDIENQTGEWYIYVIIFSLGLVFFSTIAFIEFLIPYFFPKPFTKWSLAKAIPWYSFVVLFVGGVIFIYKSYIGGFSAFTWQEYIFVLGRVLSIGLIVSFFTLGIVSYFNRKKISLLSSSEYYVIKLSNRNSIKLNINQILFIESDDNYVDIHLDINGEKQKETVRSSLKNIESQLVNPISLIYRCHRKYLINISYFKTEKMNSRSMIISLEKYKEKIPVSKQYAEQINQLLQTNH